MTPQLFFLSFFLHCSLCIRLQNIHCTLRTQCSPKIANFWRDFFLFFGETEGGGRGEIWFQISQCKLGLIMVSTSSNALMTMKANGLQELEPWNAIDKLQYSLYSQLSDIHQCPYDPLDRVLSRHNWGNPESFCSRMSLLFA